MHLAWQQLLTVIADRVPAGEVQQFVACLRPIRQRDRHLILEAPTRLAADVIRQRYLKILEQSLADVSHGQLQHLTLTFPGATQQELFPRATPPPKPSRSANHRYGLLPKYTFSQFVVGTQVFEDEPGLQCPEILVQPGNGIRSLPVLVDPLPVAHRCLSWG